jgi:hypothetical protein
MQGSKYSLNLQGGAKGAYRMLLGRYSVCSEKPTLIQATFYLHLLIDIFN